MTPEQLYEWLLNTLQPKYEKMFNEPRRPNRMNISSLVSGKASYLYHWREREKPSANGELKMALLEVAAFHAMINDRLNDHDKHTIYWTLPYAWKDSTMKDITLIGHFDNIPVPESLPLPENVLCEWKTTGQQDPNKNGFVVRAKRQTACYATILKYKTGISYEPFVVVACKDIPAFKDEKTGQILRPRIPGKVHIFKLTPEETVSGWDFVKTTAYQVARELDK